MPTRIRMERARRGRLSVCPDIVIVNVTIYTPRGYLGRVCPWGCSWGESPRSYEQANLVNL